MKEFVIYMHINKINNKKYIGQTCQIPIERRWRKGEGYKDSPLFYNAIQKYGWDNFEHIILEEKLTQEEANQKEIYWINYYNTQNDTNGYNISEGGNNSSHGCWEKEGYKEKMKESFSKARQRDWQDPVFREKAEKALLNGIKKSWSDPEWRDKRIKNMQGDKNSNAKAVINEETGLVFTTITEAAHWAGLKSIGGIGQCCRGQRKTSGKHPDTGKPLHWSFYTKEVSSE